MAEKPKAGAGSGISGIISLKITLGGVKPPIWRRLLVRESMTLNDLHLAIQAAMGWENAHMHAFEVGGEQYGDRSAMDDVLSENRMTLARIVKSGVSKFRYSYDFGDDWEHVVAIEKTPSTVTAKSFPACVAGRRACPPEDCGGPWGYQELLDVLADPAHPEREERLEWVGEDFDPEDFSVEDADATLAARFNRK